MRKVAIVGAGQAGLQLALGLLTKGYQVTVLSERSPEQILNGHVTAAAFMFDQALRYEREIGIDLWREQAPQGQGIHLDFCIAPKNLLMTMEGRFSAPGQAV